MRFQKTAGVAFGKAIKYANGDLCLQSVSGDTPVKGEAAALRRKCAEGWDAFKRVYTFPNAGKLILLTLSYKVRPETVVARPRDVRLDSH